MIHRPHSKFTFLLATLATWALVLALRVVDLDRLPGEIYGDIVIVYEYTARILDNRWPFYFVLSAGPLYHYAIAPIVWLTGLNYLGLKLASVSISLGVLAATYLMVRILHSQELALLTVFVAGVSSWLLIFSRLGNSQILVPLLTASAIGLVAQAARLGRKRDIVACAVVSALGLYLYPQTFILPAVILITLACLIWPGSAIRWPHLRLFVLVTLLAALPFLLLVLNDPASFFSGYIGEKLPAQDRQLDLLLGNLWRGLLALHVHGDIVFRSNPQSLPHLDRISGVLFMIGIIFWLHPSRRRWSVVLFVPLVLLQVPALLVRYPEQVPSASRTLGIVPIVYLLIASGLWWIVRALRSRPWLARLALVSVLALLLYLNTYRYFEVYAKGLPNHNIAFGRIIAEYIDHLPPETDVYVVGCCWGEWKQPHAKGIQYAVSTPRTLHVLKPDELRCDVFDAQTRPAVVIWSPGDNTVQHQLTRCWNRRVPGQRVSIRGEQVFQFATVPPNAERENAKTQRGKGAMRK